MTEVIDNSNSFTDTLNLHIDNTLTVTAGVKPTSKEVTACERPRKRVKSNEGTSYIQKEDETEKEMVRRVKNNAASRVTRAKRKERHSELFKKQTELEKSNAELSIKIELMQQEATRLRENLVSKLSSTNN